MTRMGDGKNRGADGGDVSIGVASANTGNPEVRVRVQDGSRSVG